MTNEPKYKLKEIVLCYTIFGFPLFLLQSILALLDITPSTLNGVNYTGLKGFLIPLIGVPLFGIGFGIVNYLILNIGNYIKVKLKL
jgi:hypothetical protein